MKTAIAVPDAVFERVERQVKALGVSRSEFFSRAAERYLRELDHTDTTARINAAIAAGAGTASTEQTEWARGALTHLDAATAGEEW